MFTNHRLTAQGWAKVYEIYPALEDVKRIAYIDDTIFISSGSACHSGEECSFVTKLDTAGTVLETFEFFKPARRIQLGYSSHILKIGNQLVMTGADSWSNDTLNKQTQYIYKFDSNFDTLERIHIPVEPQGWVQYGINLLHFEKENLIVTQALKQNFDDKDAKDSLNICALNENDEIIWSYTYKPKNYNIKAVGSIVKNSDTSFVVSMRVGWANIQYFSMNTKGKLLWEYTEKKDVQGLIFEGGHLQQMAPTEGKDIVRAWYYDGKFKSTADLQIEISQLSNKGELEWQCKFPQIRNDSVIIQGKTVWQLIKTKNGDYVGVGEAVHLSKQNIQYQGVVLECGYAFRVGSDGSLKWERYFYDKPKQKYGWQYFFSVAEGDDGSLYFAGNIADSIPNVPGSTLNGNIWLVKTGPDGCLTPGCDSLVSVSTKKVLNRHPDLLTVYPNPGSSELNISWGDVPSLPQRIELRSLNGSMVYKETLSGIDDRATIHAAHLPPGMYLVTLHGQDWQTMPQKWVKIE
ncbi:hypothetical protein MASR1M65_29790 [Saprospiraceae bacterium]